MTAKPKDVDEYLAQLPPDARSIMEGMRRLVLALKPDAVEGISYDMPCYKYKGKALANFAAWKNHWALYGVRPDPEDAKRRGYELGKGNIRFPLGQPLPEAYVTDLLATRIAEIEADVGKSK